MSLSEPKVEIINKDENTAIVKTTYRSDIIDVPWHTHKEFEIIYNVSGFGTRIIGESVSSYKPGSLMFIGSNVPHLIKSDKKSTENQQLVIQFSEKFISKELVHFIEFKSIAELKNNSFHGLEFSHSFSEQFKEKLFDFLKAPQDKAVVGLYSILSEMADSKTSKKLSSLPFMQENSEKSRIGKIFNYVLNNYMENVSVEEAASLINLSKPAFCNYFKKKVNKRFSEFVTELRINKACVMLKETEMNVSEISYNVGFTNISYFNRSFLKIKNITPLQYRNERH